MVVGWPGVLGPAGGGPTGGAPHITPGVCPGTVALGPGGGPDNAAPTVMVVGWPGVLGPAGGGPTGGAPHITPGVCPGTVALGPGGGPDNAAPTVMVVGWPGVLGPASGGPSAPHMAPGVCPGTADFGPGGGPDSAAPKTVLVAMLGLPLGGGGGPGGGAPQVDPGVGPATCALAGTAEEGLAGRAFALSAFEGYFPASHLTTSVSTSELSFSSLTDALASTAPRFHKTKLPPHMGSMPTSAKNWAVTSLNTARKSLQQDCKKLVGILAYLPHSCTISCLSRAALGPLPQTRQTPQTVDRIHHLIRNESRFVAWRLTAGVMSTAVSHYQSSCMQEAQ